MIPMVDLKLQYQQLKKEIDDAIAEVLESTAFILGPNVRAFESEAADYLGVRYAVGCASGTDALHLALLAAGIGPGAEVITSAFTFIATAEAICYTGAKPVFVDIDEATMNLDLEQITHAITENTVAILPVHIFGQPVDMNSLQILADEYQLAIIEDCAQSFGADIQGKQTGGMGIAGCFSFFPSKNLGCYGDGGLVSTQSEAIRDRLLSLRNHGSSKRYYHQEIGYNSRLDEIQAAVLRVKLRHIDHFNNERRRVAHRYNDLLRDTDIITPAEDGIGTHVFHQYTLRSPRRDAIMAALQAKDIGCAVYYPVPLHQQEVFAKDYGKLQLPVTEAVSNDCFSLPIFPEMTDEQIVEVTGIVKNALC